MVEPVTLIHRLMYEYFILDEPSQNPTKQEIISYRCEIKELEMPACFLCEYKHKQSPNR